MYGELNERTTSLLNQRGYFPVVVSDSEQETTLSKVMELRDVLGGGHDMRLGLRLGRAEMDVPGASLSGSGG